MNHKEMMDQFKRDVVFPLVEDYGIDQPRIREAFGLFLDDLSRNGTITEQQLNNWTLPKNFFRDYKKALEFIGYYKGA